MNLFQMKEQDKYPKKLSEMEIGNLYPIGYSHISNSRSSRGVYFIIISVGVDSTASQLS